MKVVNERGREAISAFLVAHHVRGDALLAEGRLDAWCAEAEDNGGLVEIPARSSVTGTPVTLLLEEQEFDLVDPEADEAYAAEIEAANRAVSAAAQARDTAALERALYQRAAVEGQLGSRDGLPESANPYRVPGPLAVGWADGWVWFDQAIRSAFEQA